MYHKHVSSHELAISQGFLLLSAAVQRQLAHEISQKHRMLKKTLNACAEVEANLEAKIFVKL